jgi:ABC-type taurine transport system ATPase subunit
MANSAALKLPTSGHRAPFLIPPGAPVRERYLHVTVGEREIRSLYLLIESDGLDAIAEAVGISDTALLRVCAGLMHRCRPKTQLAIRKFFAPTTRG